MNSYWSEKFCDGSRFSGSDSQTYVPNRYVRHWFERYPLPLFRKVRRFEEVNLVTTFLPNADHLVKFP